MGEYGLREWYVEKLVNRIIGGDLVSYLIMVIMKLINDACKNQIRKRFVKFQQVSSDIGK